MSGLSSRLINFFLYCRTIAVRAVRCSSAIYRTLAVHEFVKGLESSDEDPIGCLCFAEMWHKRCSSSKSNARATLDKLSCVITSTLFEMNSTCMRWCDLNFSCLTTSITSAEVSSCPNPIWPTAFTFRVFKLSFCEFMTMVSLHWHKST